MDPINQFNTPTVLCLSLILTFITHLTPIVSFLPDSKKDTQHKGQTEKGKKDKDLQNTTQKTKNLATRTPLKAGDELRCF
jgi:hypothetical protein